MIQAAKTFEESGGSNAESVNAAYALLWSMSLLSQRAYKQTWDRRCELAFYRQVENPMMPGPLSREEVAVLTWLSYQAGGWWAWLDEEELGPSFIPSPTWIPYFRVKT